MSEETGLGADAARARETALTAAIRPPVDADRVVVPTLGAACESAVRGRRQLDAIGADIESAVANQQALALETPAGAATFSSFTPPDVPEEWRNQPAGWYTEGLPPYIPGLSDPKG